MQTRINQLKDSHAKEVTKLKRHVGLEIHFQSARRKKRTYMLRPSTKFEVAIQGLAKDVGGSRALSGFRRGGVGGAEISNSNRRLTLEQVRRFRSM